MFHFHRGREAPYAEKIVRRSSVDLPAARVLPNFVRGKFQPAAPSRSDLTQRPSKTWVSWLENLGDRD